MQASDIQEKRNSRLLVSLIIMLLSISAFFFFANRERDQIDKSIFRLPDSNVIDHIAITGNGQSIDLKFDGTNWRVNEYKADRYLVTLLFATIEQVEPRRPVAASIRDSVSQMIDRQGVNVAFYRGDELVKQFEAGGNDRKTEAWFQLGSDNVPYIMAIPGYRDYPSGIFELSLGEWRDKRIFDFNWRNFKSLRTTIPGEQDQDFLVSTNGDFFGIDNLEATDTTKLNDFLDAVSLVEGELFISPGYSPAYDSLLATVPPIKIEVRDLGDRIYQLGVYPPLPNDPYVLGDLGEDQILLSRESVLPLVKKKDYFKSAVSN